MCFTRFLPIEKVTDAICRPSIVTDNAFLLQPFSETSSFARPEITATPEPLRLLEDEVFGGEEGGVGTGGVGKAGGSGTCSTGGATTSYW